MPWLAYLIALHPLPTNPLAGRQVHIFYEVSGTAGAISTTYLVLRFGNNYSFLVTPIFFTLACITWSFISVLEFVSDPTYEGESYIVQIGRGMVFLFS